MPHAETQPDADDAGERETLLVKLGDDESDTLFEVEAVAESELVAVMHGEIDMVVHALPEEESEELALTQATDECDATGVTDGEDDEETVEQELAQKLPDTVADRDSEGEEEKLADAVGLRVKEVDDVPQGVGESDGASEVLTEWEPVLDALAQKLLDTVGDRLLEGDDEKLADAVGFRENVCEDVPQGVGVSDAVGEKLEAAVGLRERVCETVAQEDCVSGGENVALIDGEGEKLGVGVARRDAEGLGVADTACSTRAASSGVPAFANNTRGWESVESRSEQSANRSSISGLWLVGWLPRAATGHRTPQKNLATPTGRRPSRRRRTGSRRVVSCSLDFWGVMAAAVSLQALTRGRSLLCFLLLLHLLPPAAAQPSIITTFAGGALNATTYNSAVPLQPGTLAPFPSGGSITAMTSDASVLFFGTASDVRAVPLSPSTGLGLGPVLLVAGNPFFANTSMTAQAEGIVAADPAVTRVAPTALAANGSGLFIACAATKTLRFISNATSPLGVGARIWTAAGNGSVAGAFYAGLPFAPAPARGVPLGYVAALALAGDGTLYLAEPALNPAAATVAPPFATPPADRPHARFAAPLLSAPPGAAPSHLPLSPPPRAAEGALPPPPRSAGAGAAPHPHPFAPALSAGPQQKPAHGDALEGLTRGPSASAAAPRARGLTLAREQWLGAQPRQGGSLAGAGQWLGAQRPRLGGGLAGAGAAVMAASPPPAARAGLRRAAPGSSSPAGGSPLISEFTRPRAQAGR